jgi:subtilisin family serine protease
MYLSKVSTVVDLSDAVDDLITDGVDVISMSLGWILDGPGDGTGYLASIVANARSNGILFVTAAGNDAEVSWSGIFTDNDSDTAHEWDATGQEINYFGPGDGSGYNVPASWSISVGLHWDDWVGGGEDYDLLLFYWDGSSWQLVASSINDQAGGYPWPEEYIGVSAPFTAPYAVVVLEYSTTRDGCLSLHAPKMTHLDEWVPERSLAFPADSLDAMTVGAVDVSSYSLESYSSRGPTFGPGGTCSGGSTKPDIVGYANVSTVSYGAGVFNGTSAATPHVAGAAVLVKERYSTYTVSQLQNYLESHAIDLGAPGKDNLYGAGRLNLPPFEVPPVHTIYLPIILKNS